MKDVLHFGRYEDFVLNIPDGYIDFVIGDLPFGMTNNSWDKPIDLNFYWPQLNRVCKPNAAIIQFGQNPFSANLITSNENQYRYDWIWEKSNATGHLNANNMPLKAHEYVHVFYRRLPTYNPQKTTGHERKVSTAHHRRNCKKSDNYGDYEFVDYDSTERFPRSILRFPSDKQKSKLHPTQKPVELIQYFIRTYSNPGDVVLDLTAGSGTTGEACQKEGRFYILSESDPESFKKAKNRITNPAKTQ